jgi:hypothetical protein
VGPHTVVHCRDEQNLRLSSEEARGEEIIGKTMCRATHEICGRRRNDDDVCFASEPDVVERVSGSEDLGVDLPPRDSFEGDRADELPSSASHYYVDLSPRLRKQTRQPH